MFFCKSHRICLPQPSIRLDMSQTTYLRFILLGDPYQQIPPISSQWDLDILEALWRRLRMVGRSLAARVKKQTFRSAAIGQGASIQRDLITTFRLHYYSTETRSGASVSCTRRIHSVTSTLQTIYQSCRQAFRANRQRNYSRNMVHPPWALGT